MTSHIKIRFKHTSFLKIFLLHFFAFSMSFTFSADFAEYEPLMTDDNSIELQEIQEIVEFPAKKELKTVEELTEILKTLPEDVWLSIVSMLDGDDKALIYIMQFVLLSGKAAQKLVKSYFEKHQKNPLLFYSFLNDKNYPNGSYNAELILKQYGEFDKNLKTVLGGIKTGDMEIVKDFFEKTFGTLDDLNNINPQSTSLHEMRELHNVFSTHSKYISYFYQLVEQSKSNKRCVDCMAKNFLDKRNLKFIIFAAVLITTIVEGFIYYLNDHHRDGKIGACTRSEASACSTACDYSCKCPEERYIEECTLQNPYGNPHVYTAHFVAPLLFDSPWIILWLIVNKIMPRIGSGKPIMKDEIQAFIISYKATLNACEEMIADYLEKQENGVNVLEKIV